MRDRSLPARLRHHPAGVALPYVAAGAAAGYLAFGAAGLLFTFFPFPALWGAAAGAVCGLVGGAIAAVCRMPPR